MAASHSYCVKCPDAYKPSDVMRLNLEKRDESVRAFVKCTKCGSKWRRITVCEPADG